MKTFGINPLKFTAFALIMILYGVLITYKVNLPSADDMARHVKNGELIMQGHFSILYSNVYSYAMPDAPFVNHHWLSGVVFYLLQQTVGWEGLVIFKIIILLTAFALLFTTSTKWANFWLVAFLSVPCIFILVERSSLRPEIFSYLFIAVFLFKLSASNESKKYNKIFWLIPLQLLWVNLHLFFIAGPLIVAGVLFEKLIHRTVIKTNNQMHSSANEIRKLGLLLLALIAVSLLNSNGLQGALYPLNIFSNYGIDVIENRSLIFVLRTFPLSENISLITFCLSIIILLFSFLFNLSKLPVFYFTVSIVAAVAGLEVMRFVSFLGLFFLPAVSANFNGVFLKLKTYIENIPVHGQKLKKLCEVLFIFVIIGLIFLKSFGFIFKDQVAGIGLTNRSGEAATFFKEQQLKGPIFNDYDIGSYLIYNLYPVEKIFIDNRPEAYSDSFCKNIYSDIFLSDEAWERALKAYQFNVIYLYQYSVGKGVREFMYTRARDSVWALVYADQYSIIFVKNTEANKDVILKNMITFENAFQRLEYLVKSDDYDDQVAAADIFNMIGRTDLGMERFFRIVNKWPHKGKIWKAMGQWELSNSENPKNPLLAIMYFKTAIKEGVNTAEVYYYLGMAYKRINFIPDSKNAFQTALKINPDFQEPKDQLDEIERELR